MRLGLGTVQFGQSYGISNLRGETPQEEAHAVLGRAAEAGLTLIDTGARYGNSERVLGALGPELQTFRVVTKTPAYDHSRDLGAQVTNGLRKSLANMGLSRVHGLLEHRPGALLGDGGDELWRALCAERTAGRVANIGTSVYSPAELDDVLDRFEIDIVQLPLNILDRRILADNRMERLTRLGIEVHLRSAFLQGALLAPPEISRTVPGLSERVRKFQDICNDEGVTPLEAALAYPLSIPQADTIIVGVEDTSQFEQALRSVSTTVNLAAFDELACDDADIVDPSRWMARK